MMGSLFGNKDAKSVMSKVSSQGKAAGKSMKQALGGLFGSGGGGVAYKKGKEIYLSTSKATLCSKLAWYKKWWNTIKGWFGSKATNCTKGMNIIQTTNNNQAALYLWLTQNPVKINTSNKSSTVNEGIKFATKSCTWIGGQVKKGNCSNSSKSKMSVCFNCLECAYFVSKGKCSEGNFKCMKKEASAKCKGCGLLYKDAYKCATSHNKIPVELMAINLEENPLTRMLETVETKKELKNNKFFKQFAEVFRRKGLKMELYENPVADDLLKKIPSFVDGKPLNEGVKFLNLFERAKSVILANDKLDQQFLDYVQRFIMTWATTEENEKENLNELFSAYDSLKKDGFMEWA